VTDGWRRARALPPANTLRRWLALAVVVAVAAAPSAAGAALFAALAVAVAIAAAARRHGRRRAKARQAPSRPGDVALGVTATGAGIVLGDDQLAAHALIVGASGSGKTTTLLTLLEAQVRAGRAVVAIDMKGSPDFKRRLARCAREAGRQLRVWTPEGPTAWNPLAHGDATSIKDMLIGAERFTEPHYKRAAERHLQLTIGVLLKQGAGELDLRTVVAAMEPRRLAALLRAMPPAAAERIQDYLAALTGDQLSAIRGLQTRLALLDESRAGPHLRAAGGGAGRFDLAAGLRGGEVLLMSINSSVHGQLAQQLGALAIQDLTAAAGRRLALGAADAATVAIDEFSALAADNLLALLARGREAGVRVLLATQELADLERAGRGFRDQVLGIVGAKLVHRQEVPSSAELLSSMIGTHWAWEATWSLGGGGAHAGRGSVRRVRRRTVSPDTVQALAPGEAIVLERLPRTRVRRIAVTPPGAGAER